MVKQLSNRYARILFIFFLFLASEADGQQLTPFTLYRDHWNLINPAAVSNNNILAEYPFTVSASSRFQYLGIGLNVKDAPNTNVLNVEWVNNNLKSTFGIKKVFEKTILKHFSLFK